MDLVPSDKTKGLQTPVWRSYQSILSGAGCMVRLRPHLESCTSFRLGGAQGGDPEFHATAVPALAHPPQKSDPGNVADLALPGVPHPPRPV